ncbi:MAG: ATP-binding cassette domain-containing protein [Bacteroidetes bacterium]|nr:MAG: ATP-binding cassette domain-containing protein [Bacteroidota bacterium]
MDIQVQNLTKVYGPQTAVDNISFDVKTGEIIGFLGPNGAGKTTTMKILSCYMAPNSGTVKIGGYDIFEQPEEIKKRIGYLPESNPLYYEMPVLEYLAFVAELQGLSKADIPGRMKAIVRMCGLNREKHKKIGELSKGYKQRVGLAQALIHDPEILILDEPTTGLDPNQIVEIRHLIKEIGQEKTVILSTHILPEVEATCDRILIINRGKIVADGSPDALRRAGEGEEMLTVQISGPGMNEVFEALMKLEGISSVDPLEGEHRYQLASKGGLATREAIFRLCVEKGWVLTEMTPIQTRLEDIFRQLTLN